VTFARDHDRISRFAREAKLLAALSHPNIATLFALDRASDRKFRSALIADPGANFVRHVPRKLIPNSG
jgi:serine/threonine protein kinase